MKTLTKAIGGIAAAGLLLSGLVSCGEKDALHYRYNYELSDYITVAEYKGLEADGYTFNMSEDRLQQEIQATLYNYAKTEKVTDRGAEEGDVVHISYTATAGKDFIEGEEHSEYTLGFGDLHANIEKALIGARAGETVTAEVKYDENYPSITLAGKVVKYTVQVEEVHEIKMPTYGEEFVKAYLGFDSVEEYEQYVWDQFTTYYEEANVIHILEQVWPAIVEESTLISYPKKELNDVYDDLIDAHKDYARDLDVSFTDYCSDYYSQTVDEFYEAAMEEAKAKVKEAMICYAIARAENINISDEEYAVRAEEYAEMNKFDSVKELEKRFGKASLREIFLFDMVKEFVAANASITK